MYIGLDVHKKLSYYSMLDSKGTEVKKGRFPTTCEGLDEFANVVPEGMGMAIEASTSGIFVYEYLDGRGERGAFGTSSLCQAVCEEACEDGQSGCEGVSAIAQDGLLTGELCPGERDKGSYNDSDVVNEYSRDRIPQCITYPE